MIKAVIFDAAGVIVDFRKLFDKFLKIFRTNKIKKLWGAINIMSLPLCRGEISEAEFWKRVSKFIGANPNIKMPKDLWAEDYERLTRLDPKVIRIIKKLKKRYKMALISNTIPQHARINTKRGLYDFFDVVLLSHRVGITKENQKIFMIAVKKLGVKADECVFIDDIQAFVDTAKSTGMKGIVYKNPEQLKSELRKLGVLF